MEQEERREQVERLKRQLAEDRPVAWESLPDIPLYMDQVVSYLGRQLISSGGEGLTSAMINNYIKDGLAPRANGKKYEREHLAYLSLVAAAKQILSVRDMRALLQAQDRPIDARALYETFQADLDSALRDTLESIERFPDQEDLPALALALALRGYANAMACRRIVELLRPEEEKKKKKRKDEETAPGAGA